MKRALLRLSLAGICVGLLSGCYLMKVVSVPLRVVGAVASIVPVAGNTLHDTLDGIAETVEGG